jgi:hypothetical protein
VTTVTNAPEKIGNYRITGLLGEGDNGLVYKAFDPTLQRVLAVKSLHLNLPADTRAAREFAARLSEQARAVTRLSHPGIANIHQVGESEGRAFVAMEYVAGLDLEQWLSVTPLPPQAALLQVMDQVLDALECAHLSGVRHGDVKLSNVLITQAGQVKLTDFGLARAIGRTGLAPEYQAGRLIDHRVDIYGAGVMLYRMLVGRDPYSDSLVDTAADALGGVLRAPSTVAEAQRPAEFDAVVARALAHDPNQRYASAADFRDALREAAHVRVPVHGARVVTLAAPEPEETDVSTMWGELSRTEGRAARTPPSGAGAASVPTLTIAIPDSVLAMPAHDPWAHRDAVAPTRRPDSELAPELVPNDERYVAFRHQVERERRASVVSAATAATAALNAAADSAGAVAPAPAVPVERNRIQAPRPVDVPTFSLSATPSTSTLGGIVVSGPVSQSATVSSRALPNGAAELDQADLALPLAGDGVGIPAEALRRVLRVLSGHFGEMAGDVLKHVSARAGTIPELHTLLVEQAGRGIDKKKLAKQLRAIAKLPL